MDDTARRPLDVLEETVGAQVTVHLKDGQTYTGTLAGYDQHMNLVVAEPPADEDAEDGPTSIEDTTVIRGDNVVSIGL